jgi:hypothetical protein
MYIGGVLERWKWRSTSANCRDFLMVAGLCELFKFLIYNNYDMKWKPKKIMKFICPMDSRSVRWANIFVYFNPSPRRPPTNAHGITFKNIKERENPEWFLPFLGHDDEHLKAYG